jgi:hypothetical protein
MEILDNMRVSPILTSIAGKFRSRGLRRCHFPFVVPAILFAVLFLCRPSGAGQGTWTHDLDLDNLVPYTLPAAAWSDRHSNVALTWTQPADTGLQQLETITGWGGNVIAPRLLGWRIHENGNELPVRLIRRTFRPDKVIEVDAAGDLTLTATAAWPERNGVALDFEIVNPSERRRSVTVSFDYPGKGVQPDWQGPFPAGRIVSLDGEQPGSWATLYPHQEHGRNVVWVRDFVAGLPEGAMLELDAIAELSDRKIELAAAAKSSFRLAIGFGRNRVAARRCWKSVTDKIASGWTPADETDRWMRFFRQAPELPERYRGESWARMYAHALSGLHTLFIRGEGGYTGEKRIPYTTKHGLAIAFFWDTSFSCAGAREFDPVAAQEALESFTENPSPRGGLPGTLADTHRAGEGQAPIMAWAAWLTYQRRRDKTWLERVYPGLTGYVNFWFRYHSSPRELAEYFNAGQIGDNDARFDSVYGRPQQNEPVRGFESPDLNAFLLNEMRVLSRMAGELGKADQASAWSGRAETLARRIVETMYFPEEAMFYDVREGTHEKFSGVKNPNMFLPLWAGVPLSQEEIRKIVERHMLNPDEFYRELPFPSLSYDNPKHDPVSYWRGRIWPHMVYWQIQTLWRCGYHKEAEITAGRLLAMFAKSPFFRENYPSSEASWKTSLEEDSQPDYVWSHATVIELLLERYKDPVNGDF